MAENNKIKTISDAKIRIAKNQNKILKILFSKLSNDCFDLNLDLSAVPAEQLDDFWLYTTGFLSVHSFEQVFDGIDDNHANEILDGNFYLKELSIEEAHQLAKSAGKKLENRGFTTYTDLYKIQDGTYSIKRNHPVSIPVQKYINCITLKTNGVNYYTDKEDLDITPSQMLNIIRNLIVHSTPFVKGSILTFLYNNDEIELTKMWLRGYSESFTCTYKQIKAEEIKTKLTKYLKENNINLSSIREVHTALKISLSEILDKNNINYFNDFINSRMPYYENFYNLPLEEKIDILATIISNNPNFVKGNYETVNPTIIYNIQQLVSKELFNRDLDSAIEDDDPELIKLENLRNRSKKLNQEFDEFEEKHKTLRSPFEKKQYETLLGALKSTIRLANLQIESLKTRLKLESSHMEMFNLESLKHMPIEAGVNIVCLMGYNSLVTSGFYEDLLANTDSNNLNLKQVKFFNNIKFKGITSVYNNHKISDDFTVEQKIYLLRSIRNAIIHGKIIYVLPNLNTDSKPNFKNVIIKFIADWDQLEISGKLIDFYNLFNLAPFTFAREKDIITGEITPLSNFQAPDESDEPDENQKNK